MVKVTLSPPSTRLESIPATIQTAYWPTRGDFGCCLNEILQKVKKRQEHAVSRNSENPFCLLGASCVRAAQL